MKKRLLAAGLMALMLALGACSAPEQVHTEPQTAAQTEQAPKQKAVGAAPTEPSPAMARTMMSLPVQAEDTKRYLLPDEADYISALCAGDSRVIFAATVADGEQTYTDAVTGQAYSYDIYISRLYELHLYSQQITEIDVYTPWFEKQTDGQADICTLQMLPEGGFMLAERIEQPVCDEQGVCTGVNWMLRVMHIDAQGAIGELQMLDPGRWDELTLSAPKDVWQDRDGNYYAADWENIYIWDPRGKLSARMENEFGGQSLQLSDGRVGVIAAEEDGMALHLIDAESAQWEEVLALPADAERIFASGGMYDLCYISGGMLYGYDAEDETAVKIAELSEDAMKEEQIETATADADGNVYLVLRTHTEDGYQTELAVLIQQP